jgi:hypothetical protein
MISDGNFFEITEQGLTYTGMDTNKSIMNKAVIYRENLLIFEYDTELDPDTGHKKPLRFHVNSDELKKLVKSFSGKPIYITKNLGDKTIYLTPADPNDTTSTSIKCVQQLMFDSSQPFTVPNIEYDKSRPNAVISNSELRDLCRTIDNKMQIQILMYEDSIVFSKEKNKTPFDVNRFASNTTTTSSDEILRSGYISTSIAKNFGKLHALCQGGVVKVYVDGTKPIMFNLQACGLGDVYIYIILHSD